MRITYNIINIRLARVSWLWGFYIHFLFSLSVIKGFFWPYDNRGGLCSNYIHNIYICASPTREKHDFWLYSHVTFRPKNGYIAFYIIHIYVYSFFICPAVDRRVQWGILGGEWSGGRRWLRICNKRVTDPIVRAPGLNTFHPINVS